MKPDLRIERTCNMLRDALYGLIVERGYDSITVQQIIDRAGVARSSFYAHFRDKDDLLISGFSVEVSDAIGGTMFDPDAPAGSYPDFGRVLFERSLDHKTMVRALFSADTQSV
jgi:AcrR family transcriptional regulator